jgi:beta-lactamase regulating signal transducer with metallopeptidase domain
MSVLLAKVTLALLLALGASACARRAAAATRHSILMAGLLAAVTLPLLARFVPHVKVDVAPIAGTPRVAAPVSPGVPATFDVPAPPPASRDWLPLVWAVGCLAIALPRVMAYVRAYGLVRRAVAECVARAAPLPNPLPPPGERGLTPRSARGTGLGRGAALATHSAAAKLLVSAELDHPATLGSRIVLPVAAIEWDEAQLRAVLLHERAHVARRDSLQAALADAACVLLWFHPLAWLARRWAALERERACDDAVLAHGITADAYAEAILAIARLSGHRAPGLAMAARTHLETRLRAILDRRAHPRATRAARATVIVAALAAAPLLAALTARGIEPDLLGDAFASPYSEHIAVDATPAAAATGPEGALIATFQRLAQRPRESEIDFVRDRARWALGRARNGEVVVPLMESLHDSDWRIRAYAAWGLAVARDRRATRPLLPLLDHRIWRVRAMAASALARIADPAAAPFMRRALDDDAWQVRIEAVHYFHALGASRALLQTMTHDRHAAVQAAAQEALP